MLRNDIKKCESDLHTIFDDFEGLDDARKNVLIDMRFNLGPNRFRQFKKMIAAVHQKDFQRASEEMKDSNWYRQVGKRSEKLCEMMRS